MTGDLSKQFEFFLSELQETNQTLNLFCDFEKIERNVEEIKLSLCMLNSLIGSKDLRRTVETIWRRDPKVFDVMDILIAVRKKENKKVLNPRGACVEISSLFKSVDGIMEFLNSTGLADLFVNQKIKNLVDYVFGVETGLDTNARKNRGGHVMEQMVRRILGDNGIAYRTEVYSSEWDVISRALGNDEKRFDFVVERGSTTYLIEVNFYASGGSKLNEVARAYSELAPRLNAVPGFEFVWITDGKGWLSAKSKLREAYNIIPRVYNLTSIKDFIEEIK